MITVHIVSYISYMCPHQHSDNVKVSLFILTQNLKSEYMCKLVVLFIYRSIQKCVSIKKLLFLDKIKNDHLNEELRVWTLR